MSTISRIEELSTIIELQQSVATSTLNLPLLMNMICEKTQILAQASGAVVEIADGDEMVYKASAGSLKNSLGMRLNIHTSLSGMSVRMNEVLYCRDSETDSRVDREACRKVGARSMICVPLSYENKTVGVLKVVSPDADKFSEHDVNFLRLTAGLLSASIAKEEINYQKDLMYKSLTESENKFRVLIEAANDGVLLSKNGFAFEANPAFCKLFGYSLAEIQNKPIIEFISKKDQELVMNHVKSNYALAYECECVKKDGNTFMVEVIGKNLMINNENVRMSTLRDITELKKAEEILKDSVAKSIQATKAKSEFLANMSHEVRTPLNGIMGMASLLKETPLTPEQTKYVEVLKNSADNLLVIVNDVLDFSKIEANKMSLEKIDFKIKSLIEDVCHILAPIALKKELTFQAELHSQLPDVVSGDPTRLRQILMNLVNNALKFTLKGSVVIKVSPVSENKIKFEVKDSGIGIPKDSIKEIFVPFSQVDTSTTRQFGGTGLGLSICRQLVELMGGQLEVESEINKGSTFFFTIELNKVNSSQLTEPKPKTGASVEELTAKLINEKFNILLVDDNEENRFLILTYLKKFPFTIDIAENGEIALEKMKATSYDVVLMDIQMPVMDGLEATKHYRTWEKAQRQTSTFIVALSAHALADEMKKSLDAGCDRHITKPIKKITLFETLWELAGQKA